MSLLGFEPDPWQILVLEGNHRRLALNCCRQAGKSTVVAVLALVQAMYNPDSLVLLLSRSLRQSAELLGKVAEFHRRLRSPLLDRCSKYELRLSHGSRVVSLPCVGDTIRGFSRADLIVIDEAARVPDNLYRTVRPMLAVSDGRLVCLSTPDGKRGFFYETWAHGGPEWARIQVPAGEVSRIRPEFLAEERRTLGEAYYRQEYECSFEACEGLVYPDFGRCVVAEPAPLGKKVGGIDFGFRNPFAAVWGALDRDGVLWLVAEHYERQRPLSYHITKLPRDVRWYADPAGASDIAELRRADYKISPGDNALRLGIAMITARLEDGTLRVVKGACPNLLREAELYRYSDDPEDRRGETPVDDHNHALAALRYLLTRIDAGRMARRAREARRNGATDAETLVQPEPRKRRWLSVYNEALWGPPIIFRRSPE
jgi:hypothetical protein